MKIKEVHLIQLPIRCVLKEYLLCVWLFSLYSNFYDCQLKVYLVIGMFVFAVKPNISSHSLKQLILPNLLNVYNKFSTSHCHVMNVEITVLCHMNFCFARKSIFDYFSHLKIPYF